MGISDVFERHKLFREDRERVEDDDRFGHLSTSKTNWKVSRVKNLLNSDRRTSIRRIAEELNIPQTEVFEIVTGTLAIKKVCAKFVLEYFAQPNVATLPHLPYSPDLAPPDLFLFPRIK
ncbi:uncharacterized protein TNCV_4611191 [Trichonephila clavipes]|nr:uncharacterized protein TNCV_4611191 [Trichonephila clavipes]